MIVQVEPQLLHGTVAIPASKSMTHRMLIGAALAKGTSVIRNVSFSKDITATMKALTALGASFTTSGNTVTVTGMDGAATVQQADLDCCESGSTLRFLIPVAAALGVTATFYGQGRLPQRPITTYVRELSRNGITFDYQNTMPFTIQGQLQSGTYYLEGDVSSQYVTGLLFALPLLKGDSEIVLLSPLQSKPYVDLTIACIRQFGFTVIETEKGYFVAGGQVAHACDGVVEGDYSQAAFFAVANALGSTITMTNLNPDSAQGDRVILEYVKTMQEQKQQQKPAGFTVDATDIPDLVPILAVLATFGTAPSVIIGAARLKIKESDRLLATSELLNRLGGQVTPLEDGLRIQPVAELQGGVIDSYSDHRIAMCAAIAATRCRNPVVIQDAECIEKSYPQFYEDYNQLGGNAHVIVLE